MSALEHSQGILRHNVDQLADRMDTNTAALNEFIELGKALKFGLRFLGYIEKTAVWIAKVAAAVGIIWATWKFIILAAVEQASKK